MNRLSVWGAPLLMEYVKGRVPLVPGMVILMLPLLTPGQEAGVNEADPLMPVVEVTFAALIVEQLLASEIFIT